MRDHHALVIELLEAESDSSRAAQLRLEIAEMERRDPTLFKEYIAILAAHTRPIGYAGPAERRPEGVMLT